MRRVMIMTMAAVALLALGCGDAKRLESELAIANARVATLDSALTHAQHDLGEAVAHSANLQASLQAAQCERDDLTESLKSERLRVNRLDGQLQSAQTRYAATMDSLAAENFALTIDLHSWKTEVENSSIRILASERKINDLVRSRDSLSEYVDALGPWYEYYTREAGRGWTAKLFGAGKAPVPGSAEPVMVRRDSSEGLEVQR